MSILNKDSVLVLGAGVSAPFGISLGGEMIDKIQEGLSADHLKICGTNGRQSGEFRRRILSTYQDISGFWGAPFFGAVLQKSCLGHNNLDIEKANKDLDALVLLIKLLNDQTSETIDDFIVENSRHKEALKACIAVQIMRSSYDRDLDVGSDIYATNFSTRKVGKHQQRNWIHLLINLVRQGIRTKTLAEDHKVKIISFNYDGILEQVLDRQFTNTESTYEAYTNYIEIIHPHGICGELNQSSIKSAGQLYDWSQEMSVVNESDISAPTILNARKTARDWIKTANQVYAVGFAFSAPNCEMLGMREKRSALAKHLHYCNYNGNAGVTLSAERCENFTHFHPTNGTPQKSISVEDWFYSGFLGEFSA